MLALAAAGPTPWLDQPEAAVLRMALDWPNELLPGGVLQDLDNQDFLARGEYGTIFRAWRWLIEQRGPVICDRDLVAEALAANGLTVALADIADNVLRYAPITHAAGAISSWMHERAETFRTALAELEAVGVSFTGARIPEEPPCEPPPPTERPSLAPETTSVVLRSHEPVTCGIAPDDRVSRREASGVFDPGPRDALDACEHPRSIMTSSGDKVTVVPVTCGLRTCAGCGQTILERITAPIAAASSVYAAKVSHEDRNALYQKIRRSGEDAKWFPQDDEVLVVSTFPVGPEVEPDELEDLLASAFAAVPKGRKITTTGSNWTHATKDEKPANDDVVVHGIVRVSHLAEINAGIRITGEGPAEVPADEYRPPPKRRRTYTVADPADIERLVTAWKVVSLPDAHRFAVEARAGREIADTTLQMIARHRTAAA